MDAPTFEPEYLSTIMLALMRIKGKVNYTYVEARLQRQRAWLERKSRRRARLRRLSLGLLGRS